MYLEEAAAENPTVTKARPKRRVDGTNINTDARAGFHNKLRMGIEHMRTIPEQIRLCVP